MPPQLLRPPERRELVRREFVCSHCGYGAVASIAPKRCPMCGGSAWELAQHIRLPANR